MNENLGTNDLPHSTTNFTITIGSQANNASANAGAPDSSTREPVNIINGGMFFDEEDFHMPGTGFNLEWKRTYNSALATTNGLGFRWSHNYEWSLTPITNTFVMGTYTNSLPALYLTTGGGEARILLRDNTNDTWHSHQAPPLTVSLTVSNEYLLPLPSGDICIFGTNGLIKTVSNAWNAALAFTYTNTGVSTFLGRVTHPDGRALVFSYSGDRLTKVDTPSTNLYYLYAYTDSGELTNAITRTSAGDLVTSYSYDTNGIHALVWRQNPQGEVSAYAYQTNAQGQITPTCKQVDVATNYYEHGISYGGVGTTTVTYAREGTNAVHRYYYDSHAKLVSRIDLPGDTNEVIMMNHDPLLQMKTLIQNGRMINLTNDVWSGKCYSVSAQYPDNSDMAGVYTYGGMQNGKGYYNNPNGFQLIWTGTQWKIGPSGLIYYKVSADYPDGGGWTNVYTNVTTVYVTCLTNAVMMSNVFQSAISTYAQYDPDGRVSEYHPEYSTTSSPSWQLSWNTNWNTLASATDPEGHKAEWDYTNGLVSVNRLYPAMNEPVETRYTYTSNGLLAGVTNANGHWTRYIHGAYGYPTQSVSQGGSTNWMTWDVLGNLKEIRLPSHQSDTNDPSVMVPRVITFDLNELGWVRKITYPDSSFETFAFDGVGNITNHVDTAGRTNRFTWLPTGKLASSSRLLVAGGSNQEASISMSYDQQMNDLAIKDELDRAVESYQLDLQDRPVSITNIEGQVMSLSWGLKSKLKTMARFDGTTNSFSYDAGQRVSQISYPDSSISLTYFNNNLPKANGNQWGVISNAYDGANRQIFQSQPVPGGNLSYGYHPAGQLSNVISVAGTNTYAVDAGDRLQTLQVESPARQDSLSYAYDSVNEMLTQVSYSNGLKCAYTFDVMDRVTGISWVDVSNRVLKSRAYTYTAAGLISNIVYETAEKATFTYDSLDRLTRERHTDYYGQVMTDEKYEYDLAGNRTTKTVLDANGETLVTVNYSLPVANKLGSWTVPETNLATRFSVMGSSSDPIGVGIRYGTLWVSNSPAACVTPYVDCSTNFYAFGLTCGMGTQYVYAAIRDVAGNTTYVTNRFYPTCLTNGSYQYNAAGCLTNRQYRGKDYVESLGLTWNGQYQLTAASTNGVLAESYGYDGMGRRLFIAEGGATNWMVYDGNQVVAEVDGTGNLKKSYVHGPGIDNAISMTTYGASTSTFYYVKDHLGSTLALTDESGSVIESYRYDAWGRVLGVYGSNGAQLDESAVGNRILWQGREYSFRTGLYYFRARWYDPITGRWLSNDPIGISGGLNQYAFCGNNPVNFRDPLGLCSESDGGYWRRSFRQLWYGNLSSDVTLGGTGMQIGTGLLGVDLPGDVRDISADLGGWEWSWGHAGQTTLDVIGLLPVVGALKYVDEGGALAKKALVEEILKMKRGSIKNAPLPPGSPSWDEVSRMTMEQIEQGARRGDAGYKTIKKLLTDRRFNR